MIKFVKGDLLDATEDVIMHQVNCQGVMNSGVAKQIREKWPEVFEQYQSFCCACGMQNCDPLGRVQIAEINSPNIASKRQFVANIFAQRFYGYNGKRFTDDDAFRSAVRDLGLILRCAKETQAFMHSSPSVAAPYKIGCGLGGGDWDTILEIIEEELGDFNVVIYQREEK